MKGLDDFDSVFHELRPAAERVAMRILGDPAEAEDVAAEALARALVSWRRVGALPYREAWVMRVAANVAVDVARRRSRALPQPQVPAAAEDVTVLRIALGAALAALPRRQREAVALRHLGGLTEAEAASALGISVNSVKTHTQRGIAGLRSRLGPDWQEASVAAN